ncbi:dNTP triphosphohydrolase [Anaerocolumna sp. AGMB13025]|uniref:deoxyguanosinetriphosphate triphosphohydrolase family protein n=1 Tax=Anaerocolumna sp. AGMB13025 TaxID=3039116 RepID=UPI00241F93D7|nr:dNTP triphosphohydrolase [Anaerocolumna sp. AGMB13025]WFR55372.1 dNTP triphosphohydrolase [Anaerocolumna sp. AGMB13025]
MEDNIKKEIEENYLKPLRESSVLKERRFKENMRSRADGEFQRDYTRIIYSSSFRRLQGKMQLFGIKPDQFFRNRLTHSLEVAQIANSIAFEVGYDRDECYIVEAGSLAHDIGNPPFGHAGERYLNILCKSIGGFEGNAQTLRTLTTVEQKRPEFQGLNLTHRTMLSVVKYFNKFDGTLKGESYNKQKFIYDDDYRYLEKLIIKNGLIIRTLDVQIVDLADEIAYAAHDLEDGLRQRIFDIDEVLHDYQSRNGKTTSYNKLNEIVKKSRIKAKFGKKHIDSSEYSKLFRKEITSALINTLINDITLVSSRNINKTKTMYNKELGFSMYGELARELKDITFQCINHNDEVFLYEHNGNKILRTLYKLYSTAPEYLPPEYRAKGVIQQYKLKGDPKELQKRLIIDYISGMMDSYAISTYNKFKNNNDIT